MRLMSDLAILPLRSLSFPSDYALDYANKYRYYADQLTVDLSMCPFQIQSLAVGSWWEDL